MILAVILYGFLSGILTVFAQEVLMNTSMNLQRIPIDRLKPAAYNPRKDLKPGNPAYEKIKRSLHDFGY